MIAACLAGLAVCVMFAQPPVIEDFETGIEAWTPTMRYGQTENCVAREGEGTGGGKALEVDYDFRATGTNHIVFQRPVELDLSFADGLSFKIRGDGDPVNVFLFVFDSQGRFRNYGPHGTNPDFTTAHADWHEARVLFDRDRSCQGGDADLSDIRRIGFMLNGGPAKGRAFFDDVKVIPPTENLKISPASITPNGDGLNDTLTVKARPARRGQPVKIEILGEGGRVLRQLLPRTPAERSPIVLEWDGRADTGAFADAGRYTVRATFDAAGGDSVVREGSVEIDVRPPWPPIKYNAEPFFPGWRVVRRISRGSRLSVRPTRCGQVL
ncbi:MAG: hypothetical protein H5T86_01030 [Armatimonadetes bacterium]|nr:hypothetical protein [Armatimonadota bacterium]